MNRGWGEDHCHGNARIFYMCFSFFSICQALHSPMTLVCVLLRAGMISWEEELRGICVSSSLLLLCKNIISAFILMFVIAFLSSRGRLRRRGGVAVWPFAFDEVIGGDGRKRRVAHRSYHTAITIIRGFLTLLVVVSTGAESFFIVLDLVVFASSEKERSVNIGWFDNWGSLPEPTVLLLRWRRFGNVTRDACG